MSQADAVTKIKINESIKEPSLFRVIYLNDNQTTMEFVIEVLETYFEKTRPEAIAVMLNVHQQGRGVAGIYSFEIAETKASQV